MLDGLGIFPWEAVVCGVGKGQFHGSWCLNFFDVGLCNVHTMVGGKHYSKNGHSSDNLQYHKPNSAA